MSITSRNASPKSALEWVSANTTLRSCELTGQKSMKKRLTVESKQNENREKPTIFVKMRIRKGVRKYNTQKYRLQMTKYNQEMNGTRIEREGKPRDAENYPQNAQLNVCEKMQQSEMTIGKEKSG
jgi:hypothetical protein